MSVPLNPSREAETRGEPSTACSWCSAAEQPRRQTERQHSTAEGEDAQVRQSEAACHLGTDMDMDMDMVMDMDMEVRQSEVACHLGTDMVMDMDMEVRQSEAACHLGTALPHTLLGVGSHTLDPLIQSINQSTNPIK